MAVDAVEDARPERPAGEEEGEQVLAGSRVCDAAYSSPPVIKQRVDKCRCKGWISVDGDGAFGPVGKLCNRASAWLHTRVKVSRVLRFSC